MSLLYSVTYADVNNMGIRAANKGKTLWCLDLEKVLDYYIRRLKQLEKYGFSKRSQAWYLDSENLLEDNSRALEFFTEQLHLYQKLQKTYSTFKYTGVPGHGDPSDRIKEGKTNLQKKHLQQHPNSQRKITTSQRGL